MQQLSALDAAFLDLETPRTPMHVGTVALYDEPVAPARALTRRVLMELIARRADVSPTFRRRVARVPFELDRPYWVEDPSFDVGAHVRSRTLPSRADGSALWSEVARILAQPLDLRRPPWEIWLIDGLPPSTGGTVALVAKVHHAAVDGLSGMEILVGLHDREPTPAGDQPRPARRPARAPSDLELLARAGTNLLTAPLRLTRTVHEAMAGAQQQQEQEQASMEARGPALRAPRTRFNGLVSAERVVEGCTFAGRDLRLLRSKGPGATTNDVVLTIVGGALRRHLASTGELPSRPLVAMVPTSVRNRRDAGAGNLVSAMLVRLGSDVADPVERLRLIATATRRAKQRARSAGARQLIDALDGFPLTPGALRAAPTWLAISGGDPAASCVVTNVPLSRRPVYLAGSRLTRAFGSAPIVDGLGLMHVVLTYDGETTICVTACPTMLPDPSRYVAHLRAAFEELGDAVV